MGLGCPNAELGAVWLFQAPRGTWLQLSTVTFGVGGEVGPSDNPPVGGLAINTFAEVHNYQRLNEGCCGNLASHVFLSFEYVTLRPLSFPLSYFFRVPRPVRAHVAWQWLPFAGRLVGLDVSPALRCPSCPQPCSHGLSSETWSGSALRRRCSAGSLCQRRSHHPGGDGLDIIPPEGFAVNLTVVQCSAAALDLGGGAVGARQGVHERVHAPPEA